MAKIIVKIGKNGKAEIKVEGQAGQSCKDISKNIINALGKVEKDEETEEFYLDQDVSNKQTLDQG
jgi:hypothetical protein